jgi:hypothetical protein
MTDLGLLDVVDFFRPILADAAGITATDDSGERPYDWAPDTLYVWEESGSRTPFGMLEQREDFVIMAAVVDATGEEAAGKRDRATTVRLYAWQAAMIEWIRLHPNVGPWQDGNIVGSSVPSYLRQLDARGIAVRIAGYRLIG